MILWKESGTGVKWAVVRIGGGGDSVTSGYYQFMVFQMGVPHKRVLRGVTPRRFAL